MTSPRATSPRSGAGVIGERYILGGENVLLADMLAEIARLVGRRAAAVAHPARRHHSGRVCGRGEGPAHRARAVHHRDGLRMAEHHMFFTAAKAERELGFRARPYRQALADAIDWFRAAGYLDGTRKR